MNRQSKSVIKSLVLTLRRKLEDDITIQLKRYGFAGWRWLPLSRLPPIKEDDRAVQEKSSPLNKAAWMWYNWDKR